MESQLSFMIKYIWEGEVIQRINPEKGVKSRKKALPADIAGQDLFSLRIIPLGDRTQTFLVSGIASNVVLGSCDPSRLASFDQYDDLGSDMLPCMTSRFLSQFC